MSVLRKIASHGRNAGICAALFAALLLASCQSEAPKGGLSQGYKGGEARPTLQPSNFTGETALAYQAALEIPEVLDSLYCYCDCEKHSGHKSLLSCYVDEHAVYCDICINEALMAHELHKKGEGIDSIRKAIDERFAKLSHSH
ncbi:hypothetical protein BAC1_01865 [uncultured bacterium]|nr:hypothetical protein BAC1_01865 [uncultured bacterium]